MSDKVRILACSEYEETDSEDYTYYESIRPTFIKRQHDLQFITCSQVWDELASGSIDVLLMFVRRKQSRCWEVARRVRDEWDFSYTSPIILMIIEPSLEDDPDFDRQAYLNDPDYIRWYDFQKPPYFYNEKYVSLFHDHIRTFKRSAQTIVIRVEGLLFGRWFDPEWFEDQVAALYPSPRDQWSWTFARRAYYYIINLRFHTRKPEQVVPIVLTWWGKMWVVDSWEKFWQFIEDEQLNLGEEPDREEILTIFSILKQRKIVKEVFLPGEMDVPESEKVLLSKYAEVVHPPTCSLIGAEWQVGFWTIDESNDNLEEWLLTQQGMNFGVQSWIREGDFRGKLKMIKRKRLASMVTFGIPPTFNRP